MPPLPLLLGIVLWLPKPWQALPVLLTHRMLLYAGEKLHLGALSRYTEPLWWVQVRPPPSIERRLDRMLDSIYIFLLP